MAELEKPLEKMKRDEEKRRKEEKADEARTKLIAKWKERLKDSPTVVDYFLSQARKEGMFGEVVVSPSLIDQIVSLNPVTLEGQAEIIYNIFIYRIAKWHYLVEKADEFIRVTPTSPPAFAPLMAQKERLEGHIKAGLASAAQAVADYELLKHDERKYREILDYFEMGKKDEHVLRALFVDRVDAYMGEGYSMVTMTKRWPTIIGDFLKMKPEWTDTTVIRKQLSVTTVEANVLKTKNELFKEWKKLFFPDVRERYARIMNLLESRKRSVHEYREWLKPYLNKLKMIREEAEIRTAASDLTEITKMSFTPQGEVNAKLWFWKPIRPEEMGKPLIIQGWGEIPIFDDWVKENLILLEAKYGDVKMSHEDIEKFVATAKAGGIPRMLKRKEPLTFYPAPPIDDRFLYYFFIDLDYVCQYKKGSTGPMVVEDQYWHFHPFLISKNFLLFTLLELEYKRKHFAQEIEKLIGVTKEEEDWMGKVRKQYSWEDDKTEEKAGTLKRWKGSWKGAKTRWTLRRRRIKKALKPLLKFFIKPGPYETNLAERITKTYATYYGSQTEELRDLIKEAAYRISGQRP